MRARPSFVSGLPARRSRRPGRIGFLVLVAGLLLLVGCGEDEASPPTPPTPPVTSEPPVDRTPAEALAARDDSWIKRRPRVSLLLVGNQRGKLKPCGCTEPQLGGLERLATLVEKARLRGGEGFAALSIGWSLSDVAEPQAEAKAALYRAALERMGFRALLLGTPDLFVPALAQPYEGESPLLRPAPPGNAPLSDQGPLAFAAGSPPIVDLEVRGFALRAMSLLDPGHLTRLSGIAFQVYPPDGALGRLPPREDLLWVVSTDAADDRIEAVRRAMTRLGPTVVVSFGSGTGAERLEDVDLGSKPVVVSLGELGKEVGFLDLDPVEGEGASRWRLSYHVFPLEPRLEDVDSALKAEITSLFETYKSQVRDRGYLRAFETYPDEGRASYVGSGRCASCHPGIYESWLGTAHAHALITLNERTYDWDPECVRCHVVGFQRLGDGRWARVASGFQDPDRTPYLGGVGCESCHGPGSAHLARPYDESLFQPGGPNVRHPGKRGCESCHDVENSFGFAEDYAGEYLPAVDHRRVPSDRRTVHRDPPR